MKKSSITARKFIQHCIDDNLRGVNDCLSRGVDVNTKGYICGQWWTGLMVACNHGNPAIVSRLVQMIGLDINYQDEDGKTAAHLAIGQTECVRILAETGRVDWNKRDEAGDTPLYIALWRRHFRIVDIIVKQPTIDYNVKTKYGETLAQVAVRRGNVKCVETLAAQERCDCWNVPDSEGDTPIMTALRKNFSTSFTILLYCPRVDLDIVDEDLNHLDDLARKWNMTEKLDQLWSFRTVQRRMILSDSLLTRHSVSTLASLARDAVLLILSTNNSQERLVTPLVDRLQGEITTQAREQLLASYSVR